MRDELAAAYARAAPDFGPDPGPMHPGSEIAPDRWEDWDAEIAAAAGLEDPRTRVYEWNAEYTAQRYVELIATTHDHILLADETRDALLDGGRRRDRAPRRLAVAATGHEALPGPRRREKRGRVSDDGVVRGDDGVARCAWGDSTPDYRVYHDTEWGIPALTTCVLFEKLSLEAFQSGLSWLTILRKREDFRRAFKGFDFERVARFGSRDVERLMNDSSIVRNRLKIEAVVNNARRAVELVEAEGSLAAYVWRFEPAERDHALDRAALAKLSLTPESTALAKDLKRRGWRFVGPTTVYAFMQAMGLVNDHLDGCDAHATVARARARFKRPGGGR